MGIGYPRLWQDLRAQISDDQPIWFGNDRDASITFDSTDSALEIYLVSSSIDFRIGDDTEANLLFVDSGLNSIGIGTKTFGAAANLVLAFYSGSSPAAVADTVQIYAVESGGSSRFAIQAESGGWILIGNSEITISSGVLGIQGLSNQSVVINESGTDCDFRIEGDAEANLLFIDSSLDSIGIGTATLDGTGRVVVAINNGTAPAAILADTVQIWAADYAAGDSRLYLLSESGSSIILGNGQIQLRDGTAAAPALVFVSDPDTGPYSYGANVWGISIGGVAKLRISDTAILFETDNAFDIGASGANRPRDIFLGTAIKTTNLALREATSTRFQASDAAITAARDFWARDFYGQMAIASNSESGQVAGTIKFGTVAMAYTGTLFDAVALTDSATIWTQPANTVLLAVKIVLETQFAAVGMTDLDVVMGDAGDNDGLLAATMNLTSDAVSTKYVARGAYWSGSTAAGYYASAATNWIAYATAVGANLSTLTAGAIRFYFIYIEL